MIQQEFPQIEVVPEETLIPAQSEFKRTVRVFFRRKLAVVGMVIVLLLVIAAIFAPWLAPYDPYDINLAVRLAAPSADHLLGTDSYGRDILSRIIFGARTSLTIGILAVTISLVFGCILGVVAAYYGKWVYAVIMRIIDALMSLPPLILIIFVSAALGNGIRNVIIALGISMISEHCRLMCGQALSVKQNEYITAGRAHGASSLRMMLRHVLPNSFAPIIIVTTIQMGMVIVAEASLSFLGFGIVQPEAAWGSMLNEGYRYLLTQPILSFAPGIAIMLVVFGFNMMGDGLRDALDPRLRGTL